MAAHRAGKHDHHTDEGRFGSVERGGTGMQHLPPLQVEPS